MITKPWTMLLVMMAGWMNRHQQNVIEYLKEENKILREKLGTKRVILNDNPRMRLACLGPSIRSTIEEQYKSYSTDECQNTGNQKDGPPVEFALDIIFVHNYACELSAQKAAKSHSNDKE